MAGDRFRAGDVVFDKDKPAVLGLVLESRSRSVTVVWEHGGTSGGPPLLSLLRHSKPATMVVVPAGALGTRYRNREQAVKAVLRKAGLR